MQSRLLFSKIRKYYYNKLCCNKCISNTACFLILLWKARNSIALYNVKARNSIALYVLDIPLHYTIPPAASPSNFTKLL